MRLFKSSLVPLAVVACLTAASPFVAADDAPGVFRMSELPSSGIQQTSFLSGLFGGQQQQADGCADDCCPEPAPVDCCAPTQCAAPAEGCVPQCAAPAAVDCCVPQCAAPVQCAPMTDGCCESSCGEGCCVDGCQGSCCPCGCCGGNGCDDSGNSVLGRLFGGSRRGRCTCDYCEYCGKGTCGSGRSGTLFDCLFGCMNPSGTGNCGRGTPLAGKYQVTYAHQPGYSDPRDGMAWGAQGYGVPVTVPTAPVVRYSYNYSHGTPASRLTPLSTYNPAMAGPQRLHWQSWH